MMHIVEQRRGNYEISTEPSRLDIGLIHLFLTNSSYWAQGRSLATVQKSIAHSLCFGLFRGTEQVGFARVVTDRATFAWLCDVFVLEAHRGQGLGKWLVETVVAHPELQGLAIFVLATRDARDLYRRHGGFELLGAPERWMRRTAER